MWDLLVEDKTLVVCHIRRRKVLFFFSIAAMSHKVGGIQLYSPSYVPLEFMVSLHTTKKKKKSYFATKLLQQKDIIVARNIYIYIYIYVYITFCCNRDLNILLYYINILFVAKSCKNFVAKD